MSSTHYTTNGTAPTLTSATYSAPFSLIGTTTVRFASWDIAGNAETAKSQTISITDQPPVARLTVTPTSGVFPFAVTADASASTDTDITPISRYQFNFGDGTSLAAQTTATATHTYTTAGTFTVTVTVRDSANLTSTATAQVTSKQNLVTNSGFDTNTTGWAASGTGCSLTRVNVGAGNRAAQIANTSTATRTCGLSDSPAVISKTGVGTYTAALWVRKTVTTAQTMTLQLQETSGTTVVGTATATLALTTSWQQISVPYTIKQPGATALRLAASVPSVAAGNVAFQADDITVTLN